MHITIISKFTEITFLSSQMDRKRYTTANFVWNEENQQNCCCFIDKHDRENYLKIHQYSVFFYSFLWKGVCLRKKDTKNIVQHGFRIHWKSSIFQSYDILFEFTYGMFDVSCDIDSCTDSHLFELFLWRYILRLWLCPRTTIEL